MDWGIWYMGHKELIDFCKRHKRIFCYGAGNYGKVIYEFLLENNIKVEQFIVTNCRENDKEYRDTPIHSIYDVLPVEDDVGLIIGVREDCHREIKDLLRAAGVSKYFAVIKECFTDVECHTSYALSSYRNDNKVCVLLYHRVCTLPTDIWSLAASPDLFETHIKFFKENYNIIKFDDDWSKINETSLVITFDDGYADNFYYALPILEKYKVPATIFVCTGNISTTKEFWWDELERIIFSTDKTRYYFLPYNEWLSFSGYEDKVDACQKIRLFLKGLLPKERENFLFTMMEELKVGSENREYNRSLSENELLKLASSPWITIGGHTVTHNMLSAEPREMQQWEITTSKERIEKIINRKMTAFAYPFGDKQDINDYSIECTRNAGYKKAATTTAGLANHEGDSFRIPRNTMPLYSEINDVQRHLRKICSLL